MAISTDPGIGGSGRGTTVDVLPLVGSLSRYDFALLVIPLAFLCSLGLGSAFPVPTPVALVGAALFGAAVVTDVLFLNPPITR